MIVVEHLPDDSKQELADALKDAAAAANHYRRCLTVQIDGIGRLDPSAVRRAADRYQRALDAAAMITADTVPSIGLFSETERQR